MDGASVRLPLPFVCALSLVTAVAVFLAAAVARPAEAQDAQADTDDERVTVAEYPGHVGVIVQNLLGQKVPTRRYRGEQRFDTARLIAMDAFDQPSDVVIARGDLFPDALSGSYLAGQLGAPLLLTSSHRLEPDTLDALERLDPGMVTLMGGTDAISFDVAAALGREGYPTNRVGGFDRFETAALAATADQTTVGEREDHGRTAIVARADEFADALVAGTLSYTGEFPLLLTRGDRLHPDTSDALTELAIDHVIVPGGSAAVSDDVVDEIAGLGVDVERVSGVDRVATSVEFAQFMREEFGFGLDRINTAIGTRFADALALGPMSGPFGQPIVLTANEDTLGGGGAVEEFLSQTCVVDLAGLGGGHNAITPDLEEHIREIATSTGAPCILELKPDLAVRDLGADHTLTGTLTDNAGEPVPNEDVRTEVYRATDLQLPPGLNTDDLGLDSLEEAAAGMPLEQLLSEVETTLTEAGIENLSFEGEPVHTFVDTTDENGQVTSTYTGPDLPAVDIAVACLDAETDECVLLDVGDTLNPDSVETAPDQVNDSAIVLWGLDGANLLLLEPPLDVKDSGGSHEVTATALSADLDEVGQDLPSVLLDPSSLGNLEELADALDGLDADAIGRPVPDTDVRFEVYRADDELPQALLDGLVSLAESLTSSDGELTDSALLDLLGQQDIGSVLESLGLDPVASGVKTTDEQGQATFGYDGPAAGEIGLDLVVACFGGQGDRCLLLVGGDSLGLPDEPGTGLASALWVPSDLQGLLDSLVGLVDDELLASISEDVDLSVEEIESLLVDDVQETDDGSLLSYGLQGTLTSEQVETTYQEHQDRDEDGVDGRR